MLRLDCCVGSSADSRSWAQVLHHDCALLRVRLDSHKDFFYRRAYCYASSYRLRPWCGSSTLPGYGRERGMHVGMDEKENLVHNKRGTILEDLSTKDKWCTGAASLLCCCASRRNEDETPKKRVLELINAARNHLETSAMFRPTMILTSHGESSCASKLTDRYHPCRFLQTENKTQSS